jgi:predicted nucleotidyltransferase component of viral defense system
MEQIRPTRSVEQFHLLFLAQLSRRIDQRAIVVKGGCNLRFFLRSIRYSEDLDLDAGAIDTQVLRDRVREVFGSRPFAQILQATGIQIDHVTEHKQTDTTQRWKLGLRVEGMTVSLPTKVEFSRRGLDEGVAFGSVDPSVARAYQLPPLMLSHYEPATALRQKVGALAGRPQTQARDVFDLHHLLAIGTGLGGFEGLQVRIRERGIANALAVDFAMFKSQVLAYLPPEDQARFDSSSVWDSMVLEVVEALGKDRS